MTLFGQFRPKRKQESKPRKPENAGCPYSTELPSETKSGLKLSYKYEDIICDITGEVNGIKAGSVLYATTQGNIDNVEIRRVAKIQNKKICKMIDDYINRGGTIAARALFVDEYLHINIGFYRDFEYEKTMDEDEEEGEEESE
ncbi:MAG: hypothetical protein AAGU75_17280 [Bacillota bacterium]